MPEHLDAITKINRDMFCCILASKPPSKKSLPPDHEISEKRTFTIFFTWPFKIVLMFEA